MCVFPVLMFPVLMCVISCVDVCISCVDVCISCVDVLFPVLMCCFLC